MPEKITDTLQTQTYLLGVNDIKGLMADGSIHDVANEEVEMVRGLTRKEVAMRSAGLVVVDTNGNILYRTDKSHLQHFFPILSRDFAMLAYEYAKFGRPLPIISVDSHDVIGCDFRCANCLSGAGLLVTKTNVNNGFEPPLEKYLHILSEIAEYSKKRGVDSVRFEQSGDGNPDMYEHRAALIREARKRFNMPTVYVTTGSLLNEDIMTALIDYGAFIRISFPGIDKQTYERYSANTGYTFDDSIERLKTLVKMRKERGREREVLIGARIALRPEEEQLYYGFGKLIKDIGIDCVQAVKILVPAGLKYNDFKLTPTAIEQLQKLKGLSNKDFNVGLPNTLDYIYYERAIEDRSNFSKICYSSRIEPVLTGSGIFVCTKSDVMYKTKYRFGNFEGEKGELEKFYSPQNVAQVTKDVPSSCKTCPSILDNLLFEKIITLTKKSAGPLSFYEIVNG